MDYFKLFHGGKNILIERNKQLSKVTLYFYDEIKEKLYNKALVVKKNKKTQEWQLTSFNNEFPEWIEKKGDECNIQDFILFVIENLTKPDKNIIKVKRFEDIKIEKFLEFIKKNKARLELYEFIDNTAKNSYQDCIFNQVNRLYYDNTLKHYCIDERLISEREFQQYQLWNVCDLPEESHFSVMATLVQNKPFYFVMDGEGGLYKIKNILNILYVHIYMSLPYILDKDELLQKKKILCAYHRFLMDHNLPHDEKNIFNKEGSLLFMDNFEQIKSNEEKINELIECYLIPMEYDNYENINIGFDIVKKIKVDDFLPMDF